MVFKTKMNKKESVFQKIGLAFKHDLNSQKHKNRTLKSIFFVNDMTLFKFNHILKYIHHL